MSRTTNSSKTEYVVPESRWCFTASGILKDMPSNEVLDEDID